MSGSTAGNSSDTYSAASRPRAVRAALDEAWWHAKGLIYWLFVALTGGRP